MTKLSIPELRSELGLSLEQFAQRVGVASKGYMSKVERGVEGCSPNVALKIEELSGGRINASDLNDTIAAARRGVVHIDTQSDPGSWKKAIAHSPNLNVEDFRPDPDAARIVICDVCEARVDGVTPRACTFADCPHAQHAETLGIAA